MTIWKALFLGFLQGLTEFLPISSSGHLVIFEKLLRVQLDDIIFEVCLHLGTFLAVVIYYRKDLWKMGCSLFWWRKRLKPRPVSVSQLFRNSNRVFDVSDEWNQQKLLRWFLYIVVASLPAAIVGVLFQSFFERIFTHPRLVAGLLMLTGAYLWSTRFAPTSRGRRVALGWRQAFLIGCAQAVAILPGISRSGSTIATALFCGVEGEVAAEFSFLLSLPAIFGAALLELKNIPAQALVSHQIMLYLIGLLTAFVIGVLAIYWLVAYLKRGNLVAFGYYCLLTGLFFVILFS